MEFNWTTFALEILNFLVLVWVLKRFLYRPVTNAILQRKAGIEKAMFEARKALSEADSHKREFESRLQDWAREREAARAKLREEMDAERARQFESLRVDLERERAKNKVQDERRDAQIRREAAAAARVEGGKFVARLLARLASAELEQDILGAVLEDLPLLRETELQALRASVAHEAGRINVASCYPIPPEARETIAQATSRLLGVWAACEFTEDPELLAGLRMTVGAWVLNANLRDELRFFAESADHAA